VKNPKAFVDKFGLLTFAYRDTETLLIRGKNVVAYKGEINSYFNSQSSVRFYNDYTGIFKDKSLLIIQAEELNSAAITPELTPVLYEMLENSIEIKKFETPVLTGEDGDSEFMANTSFLPETDLYPVAYKYVDNIYPLTLGNIFKENGYAANAFYSSNGDDFNRNTTFGTYGYEFMDGARLETETDAPDSSMTEKIGWINAEKERFCSFWIARNFHGPYERESIGVSEDDFARVKEVYPGIRTELAAYFAKVMDLDRALDTFFKVMEWSGKKDQVIVIIYAQHRVDGIDFGENSAYSRLEKNVQEDDEDTVDDKRDPETTDDEDREPVEIGSRVDDPLFIIYGPGLEHQVIEKYCTCLDILPTVMNLWGINYDAKYAFGNDILDDTYSGLCFDEEGNYWNDDLYYESSSNYVRVNGDFPKNSAADIVNDFNYKRSICNRILKTDYFDVIK
ncbi:MAG: sulfatase-like hydrolase/transferase, partial [Erysipelotrichaceae bacterium]|nr:sulfatase-like hydrolase/transferase [Erysipelotrichaceae bacterium]